MAPPDIFEAVICARWPRSTPSGLAVGWVYVEIEGLSSNGLTFMSVSTTIYNERTSCAARSCLQQQNKNTHNLFFPTAAVRDSIRLLLESNILERKKSSFGLPDVMDATNVSMILAIGQCVVVA